MWIDESFSAESFSAESWGESWGLTWEAAQDESLFKGGGRAHPRQQVRPALFKPRPFRPARPVLTLPPRDEDEALLMACGMF